MHHGGEMGFFLMFVLVVTALGIAIAALVKVNQAHPTLRLDSSGGGGLGVTVVPGPGQQLIGTRFINTSDVEFFTVFFSVALQANLQAGEIDLQFYNDNELITEVQYISPGPYVGPILVEVTIKNNLYWSQLTLSGLPPVLQSNILDVAAGQHYFNPTNALTVWGEASDGSSYTVMDYNITSLH